MQDPVMRMGSETEWGIVGGWTPARARSIHRELLNQQAHVPDTRGGAFLGNGARVYLDQGVQNEYCTPEVEDPLTLVRCELEGRRLMQRAADGAGLVLLCSNIDYSTGNSWGTHENYACQGALSEAAHATLLTHLATRTVYTGAGGPDPCLPGCRITLSPRVGGTRGTRNHQGVPVKSMVFRKPANLGAGFRLHIICGETLLSPRASWLKYGTTALIALCLDRGLLPDGLLALRHPLGTLHRANRDLGVSARHPLMDGSRSTAIGIQRALADAVAGHRDELPEWTGSLLRAWHEVLDRLESRDPLLSRSLDWLLYWKAWLALAAEHGFTPIDLQRLQTATVTRAPDRHLSARYEELCMAGRELHVRLHALSEPSLLDRLEDAGWVEPPLDGTGPRRPAGAPDPDLRGRAKHRARLARRFRGKEAFRLGWETILDTKNGCFAVIPDKPTWNGRIRWESAMLRRHLPPPRPNETGLLIEEVGIHRERSLDFDDSFRLGNYRDTIDQFLHAVLNGAEPTPLQWETLALSYARIGNITGALRALRPGAHVPGGNLRDVASRLFCSVNAGLAPPPSRCLPLIRDGEAILARSTTSNYFTLTLNQSRGWALTGAGRHAEAIEILEETIRILRRSWRPRMLSRSYCFLAEALRRAGRLDRARKAMEMPTRIYLAEKLGGDAADHLFPVLARFEPTARARVLLKVAERSARSRRNPLSLARILCLQARILGNPDPLVEVRRLQGEVEALRECLLARRILDHPEAWMEGTVREGEDAYWGL